MFWFIVSLILVVLAIVVAVLGLTGDTRESTAAGLGMGAVLLLVALGIFLADTLTTVGARNVGVVTTFGRPTGHISNGLHFLWPWQDVTELDNSVQTDTYASDGYDGDKQGGATDTCIHVRVDRQATACVNVSVRWQTVQDKIDFLYRNYRTDGSITDNLVLRDLQSAVNEAFVNYDPFGIDANGNNINEPLSAPPGRKSLSNDVLVLMRKDIADQADSAIDVKNVIIPLINLDPDTQNSIHQIQQQIAQTKTAQQARQTAIAQAAANNALAASISHDPNVLIAQCLQITESLENKGKSLPAGWSCFTGQGIGVTVPAGGK